ncbi:MAG TPA: winged helix-turn-helix domain-containing protein [Hyphomicrobiaceae bacterium]|nr:winged helix-turn-helix domain-containing protein [Hyphomicrobiaceae bacterium]
MSSRDTETQVQTREGQLRFHRYVLDLDRGCLLRDGADVALRPKTFSVLRHLVSNSGRLVSKEELFAAVWPDLAVTDDALVQSITEIRRALGEDGRHLITTVPRRGYRFEAAVTPMPFSRSARTSWATVEGGASAGASLPPERASSLVTPAGWLTRPKLATAGLLSVVVAASVLALLTVGPITRSPGTGEGLMPVAEAGARPAIAVLPFLARNGEQGRELLADGLTQDIINRLGRFSALTVMSWNAVLPYKAKTASPEEIARTLAVRYLIEGSVRHGRDRMRVALQLVDGDGRVLWSGTFEEAVSDYFALQDKIASEVAGALASRVAHFEQQRVSAKPAANLEAYEYVLRARPALARPTRGDIVEARGLLRRAVELDPSYAAAYAALAESYYVDVSMGWAESPAAVLARAEEFANKALRYDDTEVRARVVLGRVHLFHQRYEQAKAEIERAMAVNPSDARGLAGLGNILMWLGQTDGAIEALELAERIDPELSPFDRNALSLAYYLKRRYEAAIRQAEFNIQKTGVAHFSQAMLAAASAQLGRHEDAARAVATIRRTDPTFDAKGFGSKFLRAADLEHLREGMRKAGLYGSEPGGRPAAN